MKKLVLIATAAALLVGCASLQPGSDPVIVRAEQTESIADSTFGIFLHLERENQPRLSAVPEIHQFAQWLREPQSVHGTNLPRASALIFSLQDVKAAYREGRADSNLLVTATATLSAAIKEAGNWAAQISTSTNR